jgi:hypothetical protein
MTHTQDGAANAAGTPPLVVDFAGKLKDLHAVPARRSKFTARSSTVYIFPQRTTPAPSPAAGLARLRAEADPVHATVRRKISAQLPAWVRSLTTRRILMMGAVACYALILFNLIYGIASLSRMKSWHPVQSVNATELQRAIASPVDAGRRPDLPLAASLAAIAPALSTLDPAVDGNGPGPHRRGALTAR